MKSIQERFESKFLGEPNSGCWLWMASPGPTGYGQLMINKKPWKAHRVAWTLYRGEIPPGLLVLHKCDTPGCVNPDHLFLGTDQDNVDDMHAKGRYRGGGKFHPNCIRGHPFEGDNIGNYTRPSGKTIRYCRACVKFHSDAKTRKRRKIANRDPRENEPQILRDRGLI